MDRRYEFDDVEDYNAGNSGDNFELPDPPLYVGATFPTRNLYDCQMIVKEQSWARIAVAPQTNDKYRMCLIVRETLSQLNVSVHCMHIYRTVFHIMLFSNVRSRMCIRWSLCDSQKRYVLQILTIERD